MLILFFYPKKFRITRWVNHVNLDNRTAVNLDLERVELMIRERFLWFWLNVEIIYFYL